MPALTAGCVGMTLLVGCAGTTTQEHPLAAFGEKNDEPLAAAMFRYQQRLSEDGTIPLNAHMRAKEQRDRLLNGSDTGAGVWPESWTWLGPGNIGGRIRPIIIHPADPDVMWVGSASGGIWKTTNGGQHWQPLDDFLASLSIGCMAMHPSDPDTLFAGTGEGFFETIEGSSNTAAVRGAGIFRSTDGGATWDQLPSTANEDFFFVNRLAIHPANANIMLAATGTGIWRTTNGGTSWSQRATFNALDVRYDPNDASRLVAGGHHEEDGPYYSTDGGITWMQATGAGGHRQELAYAPSDSNIVYAGVSGDGDRLTIWRSTDGGQSYTQMTSGAGIQTWASYNNTVWVDPTNPDFLIVGGVYLYSSVDAGVNLNRRFNAVHADMHGIVEHPLFDGSGNRTVYFATDGGIWQTNDAYGSSAFDLNNNLGITQFYGAAMNPTTGHVIGGTQDNGTLFYSGDPQNWDHIFGGDGGYAAADPTDPNYFYCEVQWARIHRSTNGGQSSSYIYQGIGDVGGPDTNFIPFFMLDPNDPNRMLVACARLWRSDNVKAGTPSWASIKASIEPPGPGNPGGGGAHFAPNSPYNIATIAVAEGNSDVVWVGHNNGEIWMTANGTDGAPDWTMIDTGDGGTLPDRWPSTIVIDPQDHSHIYIAFMGWEPDNLWESTDGGGSWSMIAGTGDDALPATPFSALALHRTRAGWLYVGTDLGIFASGDNGQTWSVDPAGPGAVPVEQLHWKNDNTLVAVTHGRGIFVATIQVPEPIADLTVRFGTLLSGGLADLEASDDSYVHMRSQFGFSALEANIAEIVLGMTSTTPSPALLDIIIESRMDNPGQSRVFLKNWTTMQNDLVHQFAMQMTDVVEPVLDIPAGDYVRSGDDRMELSIRQSAMATFSVNGFQSFLDRVNVFAR